MGYSRKELFYFMKPDDYYQRNEIKRIQKEKDGYEFLHIYEKLIIMTMNNKGILAYILGERKEPYTYDDISRDIGHTVDKVEKAMNLFYQYDLAILNDDETTTFPDAITFTKRRTEGAIKKEESRRQNKDKCLTYKYKEKYQEQDLELEQDKDLNKYKEKNKIKEKDKQYIIDVDTGEVIESDKDKIYKNIIDYLNNKINANYRSNSAKTKSLIEARLNEGYQEQDFFIVIDKKCKEWKDSEMEKYLRPETLFSNKFESYLNQPEIQKQRTLKDISMAEIDEALKREREQKGEITINDTVGFY